MSIRRSVKTILVIDDDETFCHSVRDYFSSKTVEVIATRSGEEARAIYSKRKVEVVLLDQKLPDLEGHTLCPSILQYNDQAKIIFITAHPSFENALRAIRSGAYDYLSKPFELEELKLAIENAFRANLLERFEQLQNYKSDRESEQKILIGSNGGLAETVKMLNLAASVDSPVLITGETGTGKNLIAEAIHYRGSARGAAFIGINCAALPETLMEAELFGHEKGAFTGAVASKKGIFEMAEGGTLFLDEIGEIPLHLQSKLLSVLEDKKIRRLGGESTRPVDVRIIASTSVPLESVIGSSFRKDLYYRLNVVRIHLPPLRERRQDIPDLSSHLLKKIAKGREARLPDSEITKLKEYGWPGNVRELKNILERAFILQRGPVLHPSELLLTPGKNIEPVYPLSFTDGKLISLPEMEKSYIQYGLHNGLHTLSYNYTQTARSLGIALSTLKRKVKEYDLKRIGFSE